MLAAGETRGPPASPVKADKSAVPSAVAAQNWPIKLPGPGMRGPLSSNTLGEVGGANDDQRWDLKKVLGAWGTAAQSVLKDASGKKVVDVIYWIFGGGHGDAGYDGVLAWRASTGKFEVMLAPSKWNISPTLDVRHGENIAGRPDSQHAYQNFYGLDSDEPGGPALLQLRGGAVGQGARSSGQAHRFDLKSKTWARFASNLSIPEEGPVLSAFMKDTKRKLFFRMPSYGEQFSILNYANATPAWQNFKPKKDRPEAWSDTNYRCGIYDPVGDLYLLGPAGGPELWCYDAANIDAGPQKLKVTGTPPKANGIGFQYRTSADQFLLMPAVQPTPLFILKPPAQDRKNGTWEWSTQEFGGPASGFQDGCGQTNNRWQYVEALDALISCPNPNAPLECWKLGGK